MSINTIKTIADFLKCIYKDVKINWQNKKGLYKANTRDNGKYSQANTCQRPCHCLANKNGKSSPKPKAWTFKSKP